MEQEPKSIDTEPKDAALDPVNESEVDLTKICWTQYLREVETEDSLRIPFPPLSDDFDPDKLFT